MCETVYVAGVQTGLMVGSLVEVRGESMPYVHLVAKTTKPADVAELVDALVSGTSGGNIVGVQVSPSALP